MYQKDLILDEVRKFAALLAKMMGLKDEGNYAEFDHQLNDILQKEYDADLKNLLLLSEAEFAEYIQSATYSAEKLNALSQLLYMFAEPFNQDEETQRLLKKVLSIFDLLEQNYHYESFENIDKRKTIYKYFQQTHD
jgi:endonuclease III